MHRIFIFPALALISAGAAAAQYATGQPLGGFVSGINDLVRADLDGDGRADLIASASGSAALVWLRSQNKAKSKTPFRALVVCPKSVMDNWTLEADKFKTGLKAVTYSPNPDEAAAATQAKAHILVANYTQLRSNADYFESQEWSAAILDEGQYIKNPSSQTARAETDE